VSAPLTQIQAADTLSIPNGTSTALFAANSTVGNAVSVFVVNGGTSNTGDIASIVSPMGTFVRINDQGGSPQVDFEWWACAKVTGASKNITVTSTGGFSPPVWIAEWSPISSVISSGPGAFSNSAGTAALTLNPPLGGSALLAGSGSAGSFSSGPTSPWTDYNTGGFNLAQGQDVAWQICADTTAQTASWPSTGGWQTLGIILIPVERLPVLAMQAVQRAASR
jgi:hypothetical protein